MKEIHVWYRSEGMFAGWNWEIVWIDSNGNETVLASRGEYETGQQAFTAAYRDFDKV